MGSEMAARKSRFTVSSVGYDNAALVVDTGPRRTSSTLLAASSRHGSRANSIFSEFFRDSDDSIMDYSQEAAPRLESYRNSLTVNSYMVRPSLDQLRHPQLENQPSISLGKGRNTGAVKFGWVKGVYIRCLLNIWGVMLFLRMGWMTGQCGIIFAIVIVLLSTIVTVITTLSMSAICTNGAVRGGGAYYMISRSLGPEFGGAVGIILFLANALSGAMYVVGGGEAIRDILREYHTGIVEIPSSTNDVRIANIVILVVMMSVTGIGMAFENKTQMILLCVLLVAMIDYFAGACLPPDLADKAKGFVGWDIEVGKMNLFSSFRGETFFSVFAVFFPSVTGILAGANISGDLKDPCSAIPKGTLLSIVTTSFSYVLVIIWLGFTCVRDATGSIEDYMNGTFQNCSITPCRYGLMNDNEVMKLSSGFGPIIYAGIFAATLSSALVSIVSAPRILQALCQDGLIPWIKWLGKGYGSDNDPRRALVLTFLIALIFTLPGELNVVAPYISNFFMAANGLINFSCFHASYVKSPGFRPGFRYYNLWLSLLGSLLCAVIMFIMDWITALITDVVVIAIYVYISKTSPEVNWGSSFQGYSYRNALHYLNKLSRVEEHVKNYRPAVLVLTGNASSRPQLVDLAGLLTKDHSLLICGHISLVPQTWSRRRTLIDLNNKWLNHRHLKAFYTVIESNSLCQGVSNLCQVTGIGKMRPNILMVGFKQDWNVCDVKDMLDYFDAIREALDAHYSLAIVRIQGGTDYSKYLDTTDGLPLLNVEKKRKKNSKKTRKSNSIIALDLETVIEESSTPGSVKTPAARTLSSEDSGHVSMTLNSAIERCEQMQSSGVTRQNCGRLQNCGRVPEPEPRSSDGLPIDIQDKVDIFQRTQKKGNIDVWWLYDTGGLTLLLPHILTKRSKFKDCKLRVFSVAKGDKLLSEEQINLAALLHKFRIPFTDLHVLTLVSEPLHEHNAKRFEKLINERITRDEKNNDPANITKSVLNDYKRKTNQQLRLRELLEKHSSDANLIVMTMPLPQDGCPAPLYMAWLDILTYDMPPFLLVRGNQTTVLTFYS